MGSRGSDSQHSRGRGWGLGVVVRAREPSRKCSLGAASHLGSVKAFKPRKGTECLGQHFFCHIFPVSCSRQGFTSGNPEMNVCVIQYLLITERLHRRAVRSHTESSQNAAALPSASLPPHLHALASFGTWHRLASALHPSNPSAHPTRLCCVVTAAFITGRIYELPLVQLRTRD